MKTLILIAILGLISYNVSAQRAERNAVRSGNKAYKDQLYEKAEADYMKALGVNPASKEGAYDLANTYYKQQRWDEALKVYQHYLTLETKDADKISAAWSNMGNAFLKKKANEKDASQMPVMPGQQPQEPQQKQADYLKMSMEAYKNALRYNPKDEATRYNLAVVQKMIQDQQQNQDKNKDKNKDDKNKDKDKKDDKDQNKDQNKDQDKNQDKKDQKQDQKEQNGMSQQNMEQILQAIEQDEKETQERVKQAKAQERKQKNQNNRKQDKDW